MKKISAIILSIITALSFFGCGQKTNNTDNISSGVTVTDSNGNSVSLNKDARVVACYGSFAECWLLSGGNLVGVTQDAIDEGRVPEEQGLSVVGTVKSIDLEKLVALEPDYVILSADLTVHNELKTNLDSLGIPYGYFRVDTFEDYKVMMEQFCLVNERDDLFEENVVKVGERIDEVLAKIPGESDKTVLLVRAFSTGIKAKTDDNLAGQILKEYSMINIADKTPSILEDLSVEQIIKEDPDYIFVLTMGSEDGAKAYLKNNIENNPAWGEISAVKSGNYVVLPKELFHYKPNNRWDESYEYLAKIIYPEIFS